MYRSGIWTIVFCFLNHSSLEGAILVFKRVNKCSFSFNFFILLPPQDKFRSITLFRLAIILQVQKRMRRKAESHTSRKRLDFHISALSSRQIKVISFLAAGVIIYIFASRERVADEVCTVITRGRGRDIRFRQIVTLSLLLWGR